MEDVTLFWDTRDGKVARPLGSEQCVPSETWCQKWIEFGVGSHL